MARSLPSYSELYPQPRTLLTRVLRPVEDNQGVLQRDIAVAPNGLHRLAAARAHPTTRDIVVVASDVKQLDHVANLVASLARVGVEEYFLLGDQESTCQAVRGRIACVWSSLLAPFRERLRHMVPVWQLWLLRHFYFGRLIRLGYNPMLLDADVIVFTNPFKLMRSAFPQMNAFTLDDASAGYTGLNGGTMYVRDAKPRGDTARLWSEFERRAMALINSSAPFPRNLKGAPATALLYDQNLLDHCLVGLLVGDPEYVRRGRVKWARALNATERDIISWRKEETPTPSHVHTLPYGHFGSTYRKLWIRLPDGERMLKAPPWLFTAESQIYSPPGRMGGRAIARDWHVWPPPTALIHFVCSRRGAEGRSLAMALLGQWHAADVAWVTKGVQGHSPRAVGAARPGATYSGQIEGGDGELASKRRAGLSVEAPPMVAFASPIASWWIKGPLPPSSRDNARTAHNNRDKRALGAWASFLGMAAFQTRRAPVLPLFECAGLLETKLREGWVLHEANKTAIVAQAHSIAASSRLAPIPSGEAAGGVAEASTISLREPFRRFITKALSRGRTRADAQRRLQEVGPRVRARALPGPPWRTACTYRFGVCAYRYRLPEEVAVTAAAQQRVLRLRAATFESGGVEALLDDLRAQATKLEGDLAEQSGFSGGDRPHVLLLNMSEISQGVRAEDFVKSVQAQLLRRIPPAVAAESGGAARLTIWRTAAHLNSCGFGTKQAAVCL